MATLSEFLKGKVQKVFAKNVGVSEAFLTQILREKRFPSLNTALKIEHATNGEVPVESWPPFAALADRSVSGAAK